MGIPEGRVGSMDGSHMGKENNGSDHQIKLTVSRSRLKYFQLSKYFLILSLIKTSFVSNSLTERARQI